MVCRHREGDRDCTTQYPGSVIGPPGRGWDNTPDDSKTTTSETRSTKTKRKNPDKSNASNYRILKLQRIAEHLVLKIEYPSCKDCSFEGIKVLVLLDVPEEQALLWRTIDPHFRDGVCPPDHAPSPAARFPNTDQGWSDALAYTQTKVKPRIR
jgi:hypothetical protein